MGLGWSLGALVAFEYARARQRTQAGEPSQLFVAARRAPQLTVDSAITQLADAPFIHEMGRRYGAIPAPILQDRELLAYYLPTIRADMKLLESYRYVEAAPLTCAISAAGGDADPRATRDDLDAWAVHTRGAFDRREFRGGHFFATAAQQRPLLDYIAARIAQGLPHFNSAAQP